jgi:hypothetical protein
MGPHTVKRLIAKINITLFLYAHYMTVINYETIKKGMKLKINWKEYEVKEVIIPRDDIEDRMRHVLDARQGITEEKVIRDFVLHNGTDEFILKVRDKPTYFWNTKFGFREEDLIKVNKVEVV